MKKEHKLLLTTLMIVTLFLIPNIQAQTIKKSNENTNDDNIIDDEQPTLFGSIYGEVGNSHGVYTWTFCPFALVTTGLRRTRCNFWGHYILLHLPLNRIYRVTAHYQGYKLTKTVELTTIEPVKELIFDMYESEPVHFFCTSHLQEILGRIPVDPLII